MVFNKHILSLILLISLPIFFIMGSFFANLSIFLLLIPLFFFRIELKNHIKKNFYYYLFIVFIFFCLNGLLSEFRIYSLQKSLPYLRFVILIFGIYFLTKSLDINFRNILFKVYMYLLLFVIIDTILQFIFGKDLFGFKSDDVYFRLSGPFGDELIVGFFILYFGGICLYFVSKLNLKYQNFIIYVLLTLIGITIFISGERSAFLSFLFFIIILFSLSKNYRLMIFSSGFSVLLICVLLFLNSNRISGKYSLATIQLNQVTNEIINNKEENETEILSTIKKESIENKVQKNKILNKIENLFITIKNSHWVSHFNGGIYIFKNNLVFGSGFKTYRFACKEFAIKENVICTSHPHNMYIELLSDTGLIGTSIFFLLISKIFYNFIKKKCRSDFGLIIMLSIFLTFIFPLKPHGSLFSTNYAFMFFLITSFFIYSINVYEKK